jgi:UDP-glucose 4-epimerase
VRFNENVVVTFNLLEVMRRKEVKQIVFASSCSVYGEPAEIPVGEDVSLRPVSVYGASKAACENIIDACTKLYGIRAVVPKYANVVGPRLRHGVTWGFINKLLKNPSELEILRDEKQSARFTKDLIIAGKSTDKKMSEVGAKVPKHAYW